MNLNAKAIETLSINAVRDSIVMSEFLDQYIPDNDKEPSWDGSVYIYQDKSRTKENLKGRLPVQVKGKVHDDFSKKEISYSISTIDLKNYLYDGGAVLFVVYVNQSGLSKKIYYIELPPIKLRIILAECKNQKTKTLKLKEFPTDGNQKATIFFNCLQNCQKQSSFVEARLLSLEELVKKGVLEGVTFSISGVGITDIEKALLTNEVYLYANIKGSVIPQPIEMFPTVLHIKEERDVSVSIGDKIFYTKVKVIKSSGCNQLVFGDSFSISFFSDGTPCKINYKNSDKLRIQAKDLDFMLSYIENGYFAIDGIRYPFDYDGVDFSNFNCDEQKERLDFIQKAVQTLDILGCEEDILLSELKDEDWRNLNRLITALVDKCPVNNLKPNLPPIGILDVGNFKFIICLKENHKCPGTYTIYDFFKTQVDMVYDGPNGEQLPISQYAILHSKEFLTVNNIRYDILLPSFQSVQRHSDTMNRANFFLLDLLSAYDQSNGTRKDILSTAKAFADWILEATDIELPKEIRVINYLQVIRRMRTLTLDEVKLLRELIDASDIQKDSLVGIYLLLDQKDLAQIYFDELSQAQQEQFKKYPIYFFWNHKKD